MARSGFLRAICPKFKDKLRRHQQRFGKISTTAALDKDENLLWSGLQWHQSCHGNEMTPLSISSRYWELFFQNRSRELFLSITASMFVEFKQNLWERYRDILDGVFMVRNTVKTGQSWCSAVIRGKRSAFEMQFSSLSIKAMVVIFPNLC